MQDALLSDAEDENHHSEVVVPSPFPHTLIDVTTVKPQKGRGGAQKEGNVGHGISQRLKISSQRHSRKKLAT